MSCDDRAVEALACSLIVSILMNLACFYWLCRGSQPDNLPEINELLGATLLNDQSDEQVFDRDGSEGAKMSELQTDPDT